MRKKYINFNIDKLKICYKQNEETFNLFLPYKDEFKKDKKDREHIYINRDNYTLHLLQVDELSAEVNVFVENELIGMFVFHNSKRYEGLCFFTFDNKALYTFLTYDFGNKTKCNLIPLITFIADDLNLEFNNITTLEVAMDCNFNISAKLRKLIKDYENYDMFINGKKVQDPNRVLPLYHETFKRNRKRLIYTPTLYFEQAKTDAPLMRIYNKTDEINDTSNGKNYINDWNGFGNIDTYRVEVRLKSNSIKEYLTRLDTDRHPLDLLQDPDALFSIWNHFGNRLVYFRHVDGTDLTITDLCN